MLQAFENNDDISWYVATFKNGSVTWDDDKYYGETYVPDEPLCGFQMIVWRGTDNGYDCDATQAELLIRMASKSNESAQDLMRFILDGIISEFPKIITKSRYKPF